MPGDGIEILQSRNAVLPAILSIAFVLAFPLQYTREGLDLECELWLRSWWIANLKQHDRCSESQQWIEDQIISCQLPWSKTAVAPPSAGARSQWDMIDISAGSSSDTSIDPASLAQW